MVFSQYTTYPQTMGGRESFLPKNPSGILKKCTHANDVLIHTRMYECVDLNIIIGMDVV